MQPTVFGRNKHLYKSDAFAELVKDAVRFFNGTPVHSLPPPETFLGTGVYALYYIGQNTTYQNYAELNRLAYNYPIYVGKAVPKGWRQAPGRPWAEKCNGKPKAKQLILENIDRHFKSIEGMA